MERSAPVLKLVQITDSHLCNEPEGTLLGMNTRQSLDAVLDLVKLNHPRPDVVVASGDIAQDGSVGAYRYFEHKMAGFACPVFWFAGNHDNRDNMLSVIGDGPAAERTFLSAGWHLVFLDSSVPGKVYGQLAESELQRLEEALLAHPSEHTLVCLHHHPLDVGSRWLDAIGLRNRDALFAILDRYPQVRGVVWGHVHQELDQYRGNIRLLASPSTCVQFEPRSEQFRVGRQSPGYRWLNLNGDGTIESGVVRAEHIDFEVDYASPGY